MVGSPRLGYGLRGQRLSELDRDRGDHGGWRMPNALRPEYAELAVIVRSALMGMRGLYSYEREKA